LQRFDPGEGGVGAEEGERQRGGDGDRQAGGRGDPAAEAVGQPSPCSHGQHGAAAVGEEQQSGVYGALVAEQFEVEGKDDQPAEHFPA